MLSPVADFSALHRLEMHLFETCSVYFKKVVVQYRRQIIDSSSKHQFGIYIYIYIYISMDACFVLCLQVCPYSVVRGGNCVLNGKQL